MENTLLKITKGKNLDRKFLQCIKADGLLTAIAGKYQIDIIKTDDALAAADPDYDNVNCTYKGKETSMADYVALKYGEDHKEVIVQLLGA